MICAIVDAYGIGRHLPEALRRHGVDYVHVRSPHPDRHLEYVPGDFTVDIPHDGDVDATAARLRELGVSFVVAPSESGVLLADELSAALGTPGNGMDRPRSRRDKYEMVLALEAAGVPHVDSFTSGSADEMASWAASGTWPVVVKPRASAGMDGVSFCGTEAEVRAAHAAIGSVTNRYGQPNDVVAQRFLDGDEHFVNTVSRDGHHHIVEIWRYHKDSRADGRSIADAAAYEHPLDPDDPIAREIGEYALRVLDALQIWNGSAHTEIMYTADGPILVECGARLGGAHVPAIVNRCIGTDQVDCLARAIARPGDVKAGALPPYRLLTQMRYVNLSNPRDGVAPSMETMTPVRELSSYLDCVLTQPAGRPLPRTVDLATSPGYVYFTADDPAVIEADYQRLRELEEAGLYR